MGGRCCFLLFRGGLVPGGILGGFFKLLNWLECNRGIYGLVCLYFFVGLDSGTSR